MKYIIILLLSLQVFASECTEYRSYTTSKNYGFAKPTLIIDFQNIRHINWALGLDPNCDWLSLEKAPKSIRSFPAYISGNRIQECPTHITPTLYEYASPHFVNHNPRLSVYSDPENTSWESFDMFLTSLSGAFYIPFERDLSKLRKQVAKLRVMGVQARILVTDSMPSNLPVVECTGQRVTNAESMESALKQINSPFSRHYLRLPEVIKNKYYSSI